MSAAYRSHGKGTLVIKGTFGGVKLEKASGTDDPKLVRRLKEMLHTLGETRRDLVRGAAAGLYTPLDLWEHYRTGRWDDVPSPEHVRALTPLLTRWADGQANPYTRKAAKSQVARILEHAGTHPTVAQLPPAVTAYRGVCESAGLAQMFNHVRAAAQAFVRVTPGLGLHSPLWYAIARIPRLPVLEQHAPNPQRVMQAWAIRQLLGGEDGRIWWVMCCTGMGPDEYFGHKWSVEDGRLHVKGTKRAARDRLVPLLTDIEPAQTGRSGWASRFARRRLGVRPYDARRSFAIWMEEAGIPESRQAVYMGHGPKTQTRHYQRVREQYLDEDEARLKALIGGILRGSETADHREIAVIPVQSKAPKKAYSKE